ncbi:MAG: hypothetical protein ACOYOP_04015 [Microthrixaceae bacterium]
MQEWVDGRPVRPVRRRRWAGPDLLRVAVVVLALGVLVVPVLATVTGYGDGARANGDEVVALLLPVEAGRGSAELVFPGNAYQGLIEVPAYAVLWQLAGPDLVPARLLHQALWLAALAAWTAACLSVMGALGATVRARWWGALAVVGLLGVTAPVAWSVFSSVYPGYHTGALLGGVAVLAATRVQRRRGWWAAGLAAGLAVYAQPMHGVAVVAVLAAALFGPLAATPTGAAPLPGRSGRLLSAGLGVVFGLLPLLVWNAANDWATFRPGNQPVVHPRWTYLNRLANVVDVSGHVLSGNGSSGVPPWGVVANVAVGVVLVALLACGVMVLVRCGRRGVALQAAVVVAVFGLPVLGAFSLDDQYRYAVAWWPALAVLVAAGTTWLADRPAAGVRHAARAVVAVAVAAHLAVVVAVGRTALAGAAGQPNATDRTRDLAADLRRCGVDGVVGDYWSVYPVLWADRAVMVGEVVWGPDRLDAVHPDGWTEPVRVAGLLDPAVADPVNGAAAVTRATGRGGGGWVYAVHPGTNVRVALEITDTPLPDGCLGPDGLRPLGDPPA